MVTGAPHYVEVGSRSKRRDRERQAAMGPPVHLNVVAPVDLGGLSDLIKPALLYADRVTVYSPVAALFHGVTQFAELTDPADQLSAIVEVSRQAPSALPMNIDPDTVRSLEGYLRLTPNQRRRLGRSAGPARAGLSEIEDMVDELRRMWETDMPRVVEQMISESGASDLMKAIRVGAVQIAPIGQRDAVGHLSSTIVAATTAPADREPDPMFDGFLDTLAEIVAGDSGFPLLDSDACGLVRSMERESLLIFAGATATRSSEVDAATRFMAFLPSFTGMPIDEVLDLRKEIEAPLLRFRGEMLRLAAEFGRPIDDGFAAAVEQAWRADVAPALADIRECLAEHGLLREIATVARGNIARMMAEAGGVLAASHADPFHLSEMVTMGAAVAVPALDALGSAVNARGSAHRDLQKQGFYFLHKVDQASRRHP